jgi:hemerythrin-like metal-binding protein
MGQIEWSSEFETGVDLMDEQHKRMVEIYNELNAALMKGKAHKMMNDILGALIEYTQTHFRDEERLMEEAGYAGLGKHRNAHQQMITKVQRFKKKLDLDQERISKPVMKFLEFWLKRHIQGSDAEFAEWQKTNEAKAKAEESAATTV